MKIVALVFIWFCFVCLAQGQAYCLRDAALPASLSFVSGASWGFHETSVHHPNRFPANWNRQWWDGQVSWTNKGHTLFGRTFGAFGSDAKHTFGSIHRWSMFGAGLTITLGERRPWWHYAVDTGISFVAFSVGFHGVYSVVFD